MAQPTSLTVTAVGPSMERRIRRALWILLALVLTLSAGALASALALAGEGV